MCLSITEILGRYFIRTTSIHFLFIYFVKSRALDQIIMKITKNIYNQDFKITKQRDSIAIKQDAITYYVPCAFYFE